MPAANPVKIHNSKATSYRWFRMYQTPILDIARDREITGSTFRVWLALLSEMDFDNEVAISQKALADLLGMKQPEVSRALIKLQAKGIISKETNKNGIHLYRINQDYALKGESLITPTKRQAPSGSIIAWKSTSAKA